MLFNPDAFFLLLPLTNNHMLGVHPTDPQELLRLVGEACLNEPRCTPCCPYAGQVSTVTHVGDFLVLVSLKPHLQWSCKEVSPQEEKITLNDIIS